ncbi:hypothetical protein PG993_011766 [Apiospora rasikravindrae]|uniref:Serine hydrolase domain-containing protein n=1 Tax=Apiospora rasikravindrae TaxID=990691 RepID=A0ABR1S0I9_9PEZI
MKFLSAFRYELGGEHTYEFVQGTVPHDLPIELAPLSNPGGQHFSYYDVGSSASFIAALDNLESYIETEGPFDGALAYSQGAGLIAMLLVRRQYLKPREQPLFRCAILFSPVQLYDPVAYLERGEVSVLDQLAPGVACLPLPVVIVYGEADERRQECRGVQNVCDQALLSVFAHEGGHEVPGIGVKGGLVGTVRAARRGLTRAEMEVV